MQLKTDDSKAEVLYVRDEVRKMQGLYNPEKDQALKDFGDLRSQLGDFLASKIKLLETQVEDKVVSYPSLFNPIETYRSSGKEHGRGSPSWRSQFLRQCDSTVG